MSGKRWKKQLNERLKNLRKENGYYDHYTDGYDEAVGTVENAPTADVAPVVHGEWVKQPPNPEAMRRIHEIGMGKHMNEKSIFGLALSAGCGEALHTNTAQTAEQR